MFCFFYFLRRCFFIVYLSFGRFGYRNSLVKMELRFLFLLDVFYYWAFVFRRENYSWMLLEVGCVVGLGFGCIFLFFVWGIRMIRLFLGGFSFFVRWVMIFICWNLVFMIWREVVVYKILDKVGGIMIRTE